jgi:hypothetical protein
MGLVVTDFLGDDNSSSQLGYFVNQVLLAAGSRPPKIFLPGSSDDDFDLLEKASSSKSLGNMPMRDILIPVPNVPSYMWQQDYFVSQFDPASGFPLLKAVRDFKNVEGSVQFYGPPNLQALGRAAHNECRDFSVSAQTLPPKNVSGYQFRSADDGGNMAALPLGRCVHGYNQNPHFGSEYYCKDPLGVDRSIEISTDWLEVGHQDEVLAVVRDHSQPAPCDFAITLASPALALKLLDPALHPETRSDPFFAFAHDPNLANRRMKTDPVQRVCSLLQRTAPSLRQSCKNLAAVTNEDVFRAVQASELWLRLNNYIQGEMDKARRKLTASYAASECKSVRIIDVPDLFYRNGDDASMEAEAQRPDITDDALSLLPNPTNSLLIENTLLSPDPQNAVFRSFLQTTYTALGMDFKWIDTWNLHEFWGNLHCATNALRVCRP